MFFRFCVGDVATQLGSAVMIVLIPLVAVTHLDASEFEVGLLSACERLPFLLFSLMAGVSADQKERRALLLCASFIRCLLLWGLMLLAIGGSLSITAMAGMVFLIGTANVYFEVTYWTYVPALLPAQQLARGNGALAAIAGASEFAGPALGGLLLKWLSVAGAFFVNGVPFLLGWVAMLALPKYQMKHSPSQGSASSLTKIRQGFHTLIYRPILRRLVIIATLWNMLASAATPQIVVYLTQGVGITTERVGMVLGIQGLGGLLGAVLAGRLEERLGTGRAILLSGISYGLFNLLMTLIDQASTSHQMMIGGCLFFAGLSSSVGVVNTLSLRQRACPPELLGRVNASFRFLTWGIMPPAALFGGLISQFSGSRVFIALAGLAGIILLLLGWRKSRMLLEGQQASASK